VGRIQLTVALGDYDHTRDLASGQVGAAGLELTVVNLRLEEIVHRCLTYREWDVCEMSLASYVSLLATGEDWLVAIPVFTSRMFRHSAFYVGAQSDVHALSDLRGRRVGVPVWAQTACVYARALVAEDGGVPLSEIEWVQAGLDEAGRKELTHVALPPNVRLSRVDDESLTTLLDSRKIDAIISARPPASFLSGQRTMRRLFDSPEVVAAEYYARTQIYPIMHVVVMRRTIYERYPWIAGNLLAAFEEAKARSMRRCLTGAIANFPIPLVYELASKWADRLGGDLWPYGIEENRPTLEAFLGYCVDQGIGLPRISPDDLFAAETRTRWRS